MSPGEADPFTAIITREQATKDEMLLLESLAHTLAVNVPAAIINTYGCVLDTSGAMIKLTSSYWPADSEHAPITTMALARSHEEDVRFLILTKDDMSEASFTDDEDLEKAVVIAQELIETEEIDPRLRSIARYIQLLAVAIEDIAERNNVDDLIVLQDIDEVQKMEAIANEVISEKSIGVTEVHKISKNFPNNDELIVIQTNVDKLQLPDDIKAQNPILEVVFTNGLRKLTHTYTQFYNGIRIIEVEQIGVEFSVLLGEDRANRKTIENNAIAKELYELLVLRKQLGIDDLTPQQADVQMLITQLQSASNL